MRILWLSNKILNSQDDGGTGTWLAAMALELVQQKDFVLGNISVGNVPNVTRQDFGPVQQWIVPTKMPHIRSNMLHEKNISDIKRAIDEFSPDLVHIWGTEFYWGLLSARQIIRIPALLEMQGFNEAIANAYTGMLSFQEQLACVGLKELLKQSTIFQTKKKFEKWAEKEKEIIKGHQFVTIHSTWMEAQVRALNANAKIFHTERVLRGPFYEGVQWKYSGAPTIFCSAAYPAPFKGLHVAVRALAIIKERFPDIQMRIAGAHQWPGIRRDGYIGWVDNEIRRLKLEENVCWLGPLSAVQIIEELKKCSAAVLPTFVESYCVALAEAMIIGVPSVVSFTGGTSFLAKDGESALFFPPGDEAMCAYQLEKFLTDQTFAECVSDHAKKAAERRHDREKVVQNQIENYKQVLLSI